MSGAIRALALRATPPSASMAVPASITAIRCEGCGRFISYEDCDNGRAHFHFIPLNEFGPEECWWVCHRCKSTGETK